MILVLSMVGTVGEATKIARALVAERLAACGTVLPGATSIYRWKEEIQEDGEALLLLKTRDEDWEPLRDRLAALHPYDTPEIVAFPTTNVSAKYAAWLGAETAR